MVCGGLHVLYYPSSEEIAAGAPVLYTDQLVAELGRRDRDALPVLAVLADAGVLQARSPENDAIVAVNLLRVLDAPRYVGFDGEHVYWCLLERLYNPATNTQRVNIPFATGAREASTCVSAAAIYVLIHKYPAEYVRMIEGLTSPDLAFTITRTYPQRALFEQKRIWLQGAFPFEQVAERTLRITIHPDDNAAQRAMAEQAARLYEEYDFGQRPTKNSRHLVDVMLQSALTNYALRGGYDSAADVSRLSGQSGVPFFASRGQLDFGYQSLQHDVLAQQRVVAD